VTASPGDPRIVEPDRLSPDPPPVHLGPSDPLRLCIFATVALLGWLLGPVALTFFAVLGVVGYAKARRAGLLRSRCLLGDTRNVLAYLCLLAVLGVVGVVWAIASDRLWVPWIAW
jgi:hypothetical protein